jgi:hypothetical protein
MVLSYPNETGRKSSEHGYEEKYAYITNFCRDVCRSMCYLEDQDEDGKIVLEYVNIKEIGRVGMNGIDLIRIRTNFGLF